MKTKLVQIGNSRGIRIPKVLIEQMKLNGAVEMEIRGSELVLRAPLKSRKKKRNPHAGWDAAFRRAIKKYGPIPELTAEEKAFLDFPNEFDEKEWTW